MRIGDKLRSIAESKSGIARSNSPTKIEKIKETQQFWYGVYQFGSYLHGTISEEAQAQHATKEKARVEDAYMALRESAATSGPPGHGWQAIPHGTKGGFRRKHGGDWEYWYPGAAKAPKPVQAPSAVKDRLAAALFIRAVLDAMANPVPGYHTAIRARLAQAKALGGKFGEDYRQLGSRERIAELQAAQSATTTPADPPTLAAPPKEERPAAPRPAMTVKPPAAKEQFTYGAIHRPPGFATVPKGHTAMGAHPDFKTFGTVTYDSPLSLRDQEHYSLVHIPTEKQMAVAVDKVLVASSMDDYPAEWVAEQADDPQGFAIGIGHYIDKLNIHADRDVMAAAIVERLKEVVAAPEDAPVPVRKDTPTPKPVEPVVPAAAVNPDQQAAIAALSDALKRFGHSADPPTGFDRSEWRGGGKPDLIVPEVNAAVDGRVASRADVEKLVAAALQPLKGRAEAFVREGDKGWWAIQVKLQKPVEPVVPVKVGTPERAGEPIPAPPAQHPYAAQVRGNLEALDRVYDKRGIKGPKAKKLRDALAELVVEMEALPADADVGAESGWINPKDPRQRVRSAIGKINEYLRDRIRSETAGARKEAAAQREAAQREGVQADTPVGELARPEPSEKVKANPQAAALFEHLRNRRIVDSHIITDYPIGRRGEKGQLKIWVEYKAGHGWRTMTQTTDRNGNWFKPKGGTYGPHPTFVVEPQGDERGVLLSFTGGYGGQEPPTGVHLTQARYTTEMEYGGSGYGDTAKGDPEVVKELLALAKTRRVAADTTISEAKQKEMQQRNAERLAADIVKAKARHAALGQELMARKDQVNAVSNPDRLKSQARKSYDKATSLLAEIPAKQRQIMRFLERHGEALPADPEIGKAPLTGADRVAQLERLQAAKSIPVVTKHHQLMGQFMTPHPTAYQMSELADVRGKTVLDPTAGEGRLLQYAAELGAKSVQGFELDHSLAAFADKASGNVQQADFMDVPDSVKADVLLMNPPFTTGGHTTAKQIVDKAINSHWTGAGKAALILPAGPAGDKVLEPYRGLVTHEQDLPEGAFKKEGTGVRARLYVLERPVRAAPQPSAPKMHIDPEGAAAAHEARVARYEDRVEAKRDRYEERSAQASARSTAAHQRSHDISGRFEFGQPILVGHHSEKRARADRARMDAAMRRGIEEQKKAAYYADKAASVGKAGISSDDPNAPSKLTEKLATMEAKRDKMKRANAAYRKDGAAGMAREMGISVEAAEQAMARLPSYDNKRPFATYELTNLGGNIRRVKERIAELERAAATPERSAVEGNGYRIEEDKDENRLRFHFDSRPSKDITQKMKRAGFRWAPSTGAWQRQLSESAWHHAKRLAEEIFGGEE